MDINNLSLLEVAQLGLYHDDPYGDGIRLDIVRNPPLHRQMAIELVYHGQLPIDGGEAIRKAYENVAKKSFDENGNLFEEIEINFNYRYNRDTEEK